MISGVLTAAVTSLAGAIAAWFRQRQHDGELGSSADPGAGGSDVLPPRPS